MLIFFVHLLCAKNHFKYSMCINLFIPHNYTHEVDTVITHILQRIQQM